MRNREAKRDRQSRERERTRDTDTSDISSFFSQNVHYVGSRESAREQRSLQTDCGGTSLSSHTQRREREEQRQFSLLPLPHLSALSLCVSLPVFASLSLLSMSLYSSISAYSLLFSPSFSFSPPFLSDLHPKEL